VEQTVKDRLKTASDGDVVMSEAVDTPDGPSTNDDRFKIRASRRQSMPLLTLTETELDGTHKPNGIDDHTALRPSDPDPFLNVGLDNVRLRSRRGSVAPPTPEEVTRDQQRASPTEPRSSSSSFRSLPETSATPVAQKAKREPSNDNHGIIPDNLLVRIFDHLELHDILGLRAVSLHWSEIINTSADLLHYLDLSVYNRCLTDDVLAKIICPFIGNRPRYIDISNCFHVTDEGFNKLVSTCGSNIVTWKMKSVWDVTASAILEMSSKATGLEEVDLSNCRKVSDTLLARIIGWATPGPYKPPEDSGKSGKPAIKPTIQTPKGAIFGCPNLKRLTLSYCKHVTDRSMHHIASHAASRIEEMDLTRCTTITDHGFQFWGNAQFTNLRKLCLADCTYLTDNAIVYLTNAAKGLQELDLSFCCALSDTATEVLALQCSRLTYLNMSFCGSAISDSSLRSIGLHLLHLRRLSVRGCVRVTGAGVEAVADGCTQLDTFDVSQCKNLTPWLEAGGIQKYKGKILFDTVATNGKLYR
jgi:F-box/leucine-rich repeat protein 7